MTWFHSRSDGWNLGNRDYQNCPPQIKNGTDIPSIYQDFLVKTACCHASRNGGFDLGDYLPYLEKMKIFLVPNLENRIYSGLEEFIYNQNSHLAKQFSYLKKCLDVAAGWGDPLDTFLTKYKDVDIREEMMKYTIEYLINDGLVTYLVNSVVLDKRLNRVCRELDSLGIEQSFLRGMKVWNFINEKDYWSHQSKSISTRRIHEIAEESHNSDLDVEIGSYTKEPSAFRKRTYKRPATCNSLCGQKIDRSESLEVQYHQENRSSTFKANQDTLSRLKSNPNIFDGFETKGKRKMKRTLRNSRTMLTYNIKHSQINWKNSRLKVIISKTYMDRSDLIISRTLKTVRLSLPCKSDSLIVQLFQADRSLSESCLIVTNKKFEKHIYNACSCLNNILSKFNDRIIKDLYLNSEIRPGHINFKLKSGNKEKSSIAFFVARIPICRNVHKHSILQQSSRNTSYGKLELQEQTNECFKYTDICLNHCDSIDINENNKFKMPCPIYSPCSNHNVPGTKSIYAKKETRTDNGGKFIISACFKTSSHENHSVVESTENNEGRIKQVSNVPSNSVTVSCVNNYEERNKYHDSLDSSLLCFEESEKRSTKNVQVEDEPTSVNFQNNSKQSDLICDCCFNNIEPDRSEKHVEKIDTTIESQPNEKCSLQKETLTNSTSIEKQCEQNINSSCTIVGNSKKEKEAKEIDSASYSNKNVSELKEENNKESNCDCDSTNSESDCDSKCSCCGKDHSDFAFESVISTEPENLCPVITFDNNAKKLENLDVSELILIEETGNKDVLSVCVQTSPLEIISRSVNIDINHPPSAFNLMSHEKNLVSNKDSLLSIKKNFMLDEKNLLSEEKKNFRSVSRTKICKCDNIEVVDQARKQKNRKRCFTAQRFSSEKQWPAVADDVRFHQNQHTVLSSLSSECKSSSGSSEEQSRMKNRDIRMKSRLPACYSPLSLKSKLQRSEKPIHTIHFTARISSNSFKHLSRLDSMRHVEFKLKPRKREDNYSIFSRYKNYICRKSIVSSNFSNSFSMKSIDRMKYLIRKKLCKLLLNERDREEGTSKRFLRNDRYQRDILKVKTKEEEVLCPPCFSSSCNSPCMRSHSEVIEDSNMLTSTDRHSVNRRDISKEGLKKQRMSGGANITKNACVVDKSSVSRRRPTKGSNLCEFNNNRESRKDKYLRKTQGISNGRRLLCNNPREERLINENSSGRTKLLLVQNEFSFNGSMTESLIDERNRSLNKTFYKKNSWKGLKETSKPYNLYKEDYNLFKRNLYSNRSERNYRKPSYPQICVDGNENRRNKFMDTKRMKNTDTLYNLGYNKIQNLEKCSKIHLKKELFEESGHYRHFGNNYEKCIDNLSVDFRYKLLQYVTLCKSVKDSLIKRLRPDEIYGVRSTAIP